ncbi:SRPBCC family protein [Gracilibacillus caseinilyticus]|uniref:SRPBCC family protein n=1 Tax=Gracilibacillus caseinilyticus TaxID=2932256 RepID=A0ABY4ERR0_9BACI|nr:SRPBCC family protein [Gracilibacillus caseinilyticus]UOQ47124.1 SRPBCC family protein [Gracilibacillus caseinilyticus]
MPSGTHFVQLDLPIGKVWDFVSDFEKWADLVPGYIEHRVQDDYRSVWKFKGEVAKIHKTITLYITITKWEKPNCVSFSLQDKSKNIVGEGCFKANAEDGKHTDVTGSLTITANGILGPMVNGVMKTFIPKTTIEFTEEVANRMVEESAVSK